MGCGSTTQQTSTNTSPPGYVSQAYQNLLGAATNQAQKPLQQYGGSLVQGFTPDQMAAFKTIGNAQGMGQPYINAASDQFGKASTPFYQNVQQYESPYTQDVTKSLTNLFDQQNAQQQQQLQGNLVGQGAFGGDRQAIMQATLAGQQQLNQAPTLANVLQGGYQTALGASEAQGWLGQQTGFGLASLGNESQNLALSGASAQLQSGGLQQQLGQEQLNIPYEQFQQQQAYPFQTLGWLGGLTTGIGSNSGGTSGTGYPGPNMAGQIAGLGVAGLGAYGLGNQQGWWGSGSGSGSSGGGSSGGYGSSAPYDYSGNPYRSGGRVGFDAGGAPGFDAAAVPNVDVDLAPGLTLTQGKGPPVAPTTPAAAASSSGLGGLSSLMGLGSSAAKLFGGAGAGAGAAGAAGAEAAGAVGAEAATANAAELLPLLLLAYGGRVGFDAGGNVGFTALPPVPKMSLDYLANPGPTVKGAGPPKPPTVPNSAIEAANFNPAALTSEMNTVSGALGKSKPAAATVGLDGGVGEADGGTVGFAGGGAPGAMGSPAAAMNPQAQAQTQQYDQMPMDQLQALAARIPPGSPQAQQVQRALNNRRMNPTAGGQVSSAGGVGIGTGAGITSMAEGGQIPDEPDMDPHPIVDHSGPTVVIRYPSEGKSLDLGIPSMPREKRADGGSANPAITFIKAPNGIDIPKISGDLFGKVGAGSGVDPSQPWFNPLPQYRPPGTTIDAGGIHCPTLGSAIPPGLSGLGGGSARGGRIGFDAGGDTALPLEPAQDLDIPGTGEGTLVAGRLTPAWVGDDKLSDADPDILRAHAAVDLGDHAPPPASRAATPVPLAAGLTPRPTSSAGAGLDMDASLREPLPVVETAATPPVAERAAAAVDAGVAPPGAGSITTPVVARPPQATTAPSARRDDVVNFWVGKGAPQHVAEGIADRVNAESGFDPTVPGDNGTSVGLYQHHADRMARLMGLPNWQNPAVQNQFAYSEVTGGDPIATKHWQEILAAPDRQTASTLWDKYFERSAGSQLTPGGWYRGPATGGTPIAGDSGEPPRAGASGAGFGAADTGAGRGFTAAASPKTAVETTYDAALKTILTDLQKSPEKISSYYSSPWYPVLAAGLGMMASRSPYLLGAIGEGGLRGTAALAEQQAQIPKIELARTEAEKARLATGLTKAQLLYTLTPTAGAGSETTTAAGAGASGGAGVAVSPSGATGTGPSGTTPAAVPSGGGTGAGASAPPGSAAQFKWFDDQYAYLERLANAPGLPAQQLTAREQLIKLKEQDPRNKAIGAGMAKAAEMPYTVSSVRPGGVVTQGGQPIYAVPQRVPSVDPATGRESLVWEAPPLPGQPLPPPIETKLGPGEHAGMVAAAESRYKMEPYEVALPGGAGSMTLLAPQEQVRTGTAPGIKEPLTAAAMVPPGGPVTQDGKYDPDPETLIPVAPPPGVTAQKIELSEAAKHKLDDDTKTLEIYRKTAQDTPLQLSRIDQLSRLMDQYKTGRLADAGYNLSAWAKATGLGNLIPVGYDPTKAEEINKLATQLVFSQIKQIGGRVLVSEIEGLGKANPNIALTPEANRAILENVALEQHLAQDRYLNASRVFGRYKQLGDFDRKYIENSPAGALEQSIHAQLAPFAQPQKQTAIPTGYPSNAIPGPAGEGGQRKWYVPAPGGKGYQEILPARP